jgi:hypothetical protein
MAFSTVAAIAAVAAVAAVAEGREASLGMVSTNVVAVSPFCRAAGE